MGLIISPSTGEETEIQRARVIGSGAPDRKPLGNDLNPLGDEPWGRMGGRRGNGHVGRVWPGGWVAVEGSVQVGGNKEEMGTAKMGSHRNEGADLDGLRLQFEAVEGVDGFVCIVGVRVVHKSVAEALPCRQDQDDDLPGSSQTQA